MTNQLIQRIKEALRKSWSRDTCIIFEEDYPYYGQCAQTAIVINEKFGGDILKTQGWPNEKGYGRHFYNRIDGVNYDFTAEQFTDIPDYTCDIKYQDIPSSIKEAETETNKQQIAALRHAFNNAFDKS
jgi:hypothetical protein